ncbi:MAG: hypothetical protein AB7O28_23585 [Vicinamibacterales bacterium]
MSNHGDNHVLKADRSGHDRLRMICQVHDRDTRELLRTAGFSAGVRTVEFGCGLGTVSRWIASEGEHVAACQPHYATGGENGRWSWTFAEAGQSLVQAGRLDVAQ